MLKNYEVIYMAFPEGLEHVESITIKNKVYKNSNYSGSSNTQISYLKTK